MLNEKKKPLFLLSLSDIGAGKRGAANGPLAVKNEIERLGLQIKEFDVLDNRSFIADNLNHNYGKHIEDVFTAMVNLNDKVVQIISDKKLPIILSGDHSNAIGGLSGLKNANPDKKIGVIWIDAHADLHSPYTTPSGNLHGMPLAALAGIDSIELKKNDVDETVAGYWNRLKQIGDHQISPKFDIKDLVIIALRDAEEEEWKVIEKLGVRTYTPDNIREKRIEEVLDETLIGLSHCDLIYVSFDADSLDPGISTGTGTIAPDGLKIDEAQIIFKTLLSQPKLGVFEITEVNPSLDTTSRLMAEVIGGLVVHGLK